MTVAGHVGALLACVCASVGEACGLGVEGAQALTKQRRRTCEWDGSGSRFSLASGGAGARARAESRGRLMAIKARPYQLKAAVQPPTLRCPAPCGHVPFGTRSTSPAPSGAAAAVSGQCSVWGTDPRGSCVVGTWGRFQSCQRVAVRSSGVTQSLFVEKTVWVCRLKSVHGTRRFRFCR